MTPEEKTAKEAADKKAADEKAAADKKAADKKAADEKAAADKKAPVTVYTPVTTFKGERLGVKFKDGQGVTDKETAKEICAAFKSYSLKPFTDEED